MGGCTPPAHRRAHLHGTFFALDFLDQKRIRDILLSHPPEYLLFGTDSPWTDQATTLKMLGRLGLPETLFDQITSGNALRLLGQ